MASLSSIRIPSNATPVLKRIGDLTGESANALVEALSTGDVRTMPALKAAVKSATPDSWEADDVDSFVRHLMTMSTLGASHDFSSTELASAITEKVDLNLDVSGKAELSRRLAALLAARDFQAFSKAVDIATEYDQVLHFSRIVSDVRPVFETDATKDPAGAVIVHTLRIDYFNEGRVKTTSFALNENDLAQLKVVVDRAAEKQQTLSRMLEQLSMLEFDMTGDDDE